MIFPLPIAHPRLLHPHPSTPRGPQPAVEAPTDSPSTLGQDIPDAARLAPAPAAQPVSDYLPMPQAARVD